MTDEKRRVLDLLAKGKITVDEAQQLLDAIGTVSGEVSTPSPDEGQRPQPRWVRIAIHKTAKEGHRDKDVNIRVPIGMVKTGMRLGALIPGLAGEQVAARMRERGLDVDFSKLDAAAIESVLKSLSDTNIEIDSGKAQVRITTE
jgi:hypothetical protein